MRVTKFIRLGWAEPIARMEEGRGAFKIVNIKYTGNKTLEGPRRRFVGVYKIRT